MNIADLSKKVGQLLSRRKETLSLAESCTGGAVASAITDIAGASKYFMGGVVPYGNRSKIELLGVSEKTLAQFGAVSEPVAKAMAEGARRRFGTDYAIAVTGIAGPTGGSKEKPVGTVFIAWATPQKTEVRSFCLQRDRLEFKQWVTATALDGLRRVLL